MEATSSLRGDSLWVQLPPPVVKRDSVNIAFATRVFASPTVFETFVFNSSQEDNGQGVVPAELGADQVFVPEAVQGASLIRNLRHSVAIHAQWRRGQRPVRSEFHRHQD